MAILRMSTVFAQCANELPSEEKVKLARVFMLLTDNPGHPILQLQKLPCARRSNVYECRLDRSWKIILQRTGEITYDLIYVGTAEDAVHFGETLREESAGYGGESSALGRVHCYLSGDDTALEFTAIDPDDLVQPELLFR
jgi:hypothetical protein